MVMEDIMRGEDDVAQLGPAGGAVNAGGLHHVLVQAHEAGHVDEDHVAGQLPHGHQHQSGKGQAGVGQPGALEEAPAGGVADAHEHAGEHELPDVAQHQAADEVGGKEAGPEEVLGLMPRVSR